MTIMIGRWTYWKRTFILAVTGSLLLILPGQRLQAQQQPFPFLQPGFFQELFATAPLPGGEIDGGIAFAPNGDVWVDSCNREELFRFLTSATTTLHGSSVHPQAVNSPVASNVGCGLTNHPDGTLYSNNFGVANVDAGTGAPLRPSFGPFGNGLGIVVDPQTNNLVYVGGPCFGTPPCTIVSANPVTMQSSVFAQLDPADATFIDGIAFDPSGKFLFMSVRTPDPGLTILDRNGTVLQHIQIPGIPDGVAFHQDPDFVVTNNNNGNILRLDFPGDDFSQPPIRSFLASGGFRGDLTAVGPDGCFYATQNGTRFADGTVSTDNSIVRICPGFVPAPGVALPFAEFEVRDLDIRRRDRDKDQDEDESFSLKGEFLPNAKTVGVDLRHQAVTLMIGSFSVTIPPNSFNQEGEHRFKFEGKVNGISLAFTIAADQDGRAGDKKEAEFSFSVKAKGVDLSSLASPVTVRLVVGPNAGTTTVNTARDDDDDR